MSSVESAALGFDDRLVSITGTIGDLQWEGITAKELIVGESLSNPGIMVSITFQSVVYTDPLKDYQKLKDQSLNVILRNKLAQQQSSSAENEFHIEEMKIYRMDNRAMMPVNLGRTEEFTVHACHETLLDDAKHLMNKLWKCTVPSDVVREALECVKAKNVDVQDCQPKRDYIAENIHPYQVIQQQCNAALDGQDPSFVHYMTFGDGSNNDWKPKHHFKSLKSLIEKADMEVAANKTFKFSTADIGIRTNTDYNSNKNRVIVFEFPCDFDLLSDLLNGVGPNGSNYNSLATFNPMNMSGGIFGGAQNNMMSSPCYEGFNFNESITNKGSNDQSGCASDVESHLLLRQARMGLLERDKIALRMTIPWSPHVHAGDIIKFEWYDRQNNLVSGSGNYLVASMKHDVQFGGFSTTKLDCIKTKF